MGSVEYKYDSITNTKYYIVRTNKSPFVYAPNGANKGKCRAINFDFPICINAGLFNPKMNCYEPEGIIIQDSKVIQNSSALFYPDSMPLTINKQGKLWYADANTDAYKLVEQGVVSAVCGFMPIIINHKPVPQNKWTKVPHYDKPHQRQIIGQCDDGSYMIITCEGRDYADSKGWTIKDAQRICVENNLDFAYNLDGGTSTETVVNGIQLNSVYERAEGRFASTFIIFK